MNYKEQLQNLAQKYQVGGQVPTDWKAKYSTNPYFKDREDWGESLDKKFPNAKNTVRQSIYAASKRTGIDPGLLYTSAMEEGMKLALTGKDTGVRREGFVDYQKNNPKAKEYPIDGGYYYGLNTFGDKYGKTIKVSNLPKGFKYTPYPQKGTDGSVAFNSAAFRTHEDAISAKAAQMKQVEEAMNYKLRDAKIDLSPEARKFFDMVGYNMGEEKTIEMIRSYQQKGYLKDDRFLDSKFQPASWKEPYTNVQRRYQNYRILNEQGYFNDYNTPNPKVAVTGSTKEPNSFQVGGEIENMLSKLNPKNWGVEDYTDKGNFQKAYTSARQKGLKEFMFEGKRFSTDYKGTPDEQLRQTGIIDNVNKNKPSELQKRITGNVYNGGFYHDYKLSDVEKLLQPVVKKERSIGLEEEMLNLYLKIPTQGRSLGISKYKPTKAKDKGVQYYKVNDFTSGLDEDVENIEEYASKLNANKKGNAGMGDYTVDSGKDARGKYISYYDIWDINPFGQGKDAPDLSMGYGKPFEIYDRIYYNDYGNKGKYKKMYFSDDELRNLDPDEKNFDTLAVQKELTNRGYKLPNSIKKKGLFDDNSEFDGIYGDETKKALQDWQSKNTKKFQSGGMIRSELQKLSEKFSQRLSTT